MHSVRPVWVFERFSEVEDAGVVGMRGSLTGGEDVRTRERESYTPLRLPALQALQALIMIHKRSTRHV